MKKQSDFYFIEDDDLGLRRITMNDDLSNYVKWFNDQEVTKHSTHGKYPMTLSDIEKYILSIEKCHLHLSVFIKQTREHIGNISLQSIDHINQSAEFAIMFGEKQYWGKGYAYKAAKLIIDHAIQKLNLRRIYCGTADGNIGMKKLALKLGMSEEGRRKEAFFFEGYYVDIVEFGMIVKV